MSLTDQLVTTGAGNFPTTPDHPTSLTSIPLVLSPQLLVHSPDVALVDEKLYSGFLEHLGRCIYGGIVDNVKDPSPERLLVKQDDGQEFTKGRAGWRKDVMGIIGKEGDLEVPMLRWPGGNFVSNYHWQDGIGPIAQRPKRLELAWLSDESNQFGTDEFIDYCRATKCEPYLCLNMGTGTFEEALAWLEYCNGTGDTHWASLRRKNTGRDEPHAVKYWGLGNEMWGPWQVGNMTAAEYARAAKRWAHGLKLVDPTIRLVSCGNTGATDWDREVLQEVIDFVDLHSIHFYTMLGHDKMSNVPGFEYEKNVFGPAAAEKYIEVCKSLIDLANVERAAQRKPSKDIKICYDEWNVWDEVKAPGSIGLEQTYDYTDMLGVCAWLNVLVRHHRDIGIACIAQSVNVISPLMTRPDGILFQTTYYPLRLFSKYMKNGRLLQLPSMPEVYDGPTFPVWIQQTACRPAYIDVVAVMVGDSIRVSVLNRHPTLDWEAKFHFIGYESTGCEVHEIYQDDLTAANTFERPDVVVPVIHKLAAGISFIVRRHSWCFFIIDGTAT